MPVRLLGDAIAFPPVDEAEPDGLLAIGGDLRAERLLLAYREGIFPWYGEEQPILWHSPDPRFVLPVVRLYVGQRLERTIRRRPYRLTLDTSFDDVVAACSTVPRPGQPGTWITRRMRAAYSRLHRRGVAHSIEAWRGEELVGGAYGVSLGGVFFGESMFARAADASKVAFVALARQLGRWGIDLIDCQVYTEHLERFGAEEWPRARFLAALRDALERPTRPGPWRFDDDAAATD